MRRSLLVIIGAFLLMGAEDSTDSVLDAATDAVHAAHGPVMEPIPVSPQIEHPGHQGILNLGGREWQISASLRDHYARDFSALKGLANPSAHRGSTGKIDGYSLRLERHGLAHQAGFRNGDVVHAINGYSLADWTKVLAAYKKLRAEDELQVVLSRRNGQRLKLNYHIK